MLSTTSRLTEKSNGRLDDSLDHDTHDYAHKSRDTDFPGGDGILPRKDMLSTDHDPEQAAGAQDDANRRRGKLSFSERSLRITWAWFPASLSTNSMASVISQQPYTFPGLETIGKIFYILSIVMFCLFLGLIIARFVRKPRAIRTSLHHPSESFFFGGFWVNFALMILGMQSYGVPASGEWLLRAVRILYWIYFAAAMLIAVLQYHVIFQVERLTPEDAMPVWILPAYPFLVSGVLAANVAETQPQQYAVELILAGIAGLGLGWMLALFVYTVYLNRLISGSMPEPSLRPGMYMSVGPAAYTCAGLISLGKQAMERLPDDFLGITTFPVGELWYAISVPAGLFLWLIAIWFSALSTVSIVHSVRKMSFALQWWSFIFPNAGLASATIQVGQALDSKPIKLAATVITIMLVPLWFMIAIAHVRAIWLRQILAPGKDIGVDDVNSKHDIKAERARARKELRRETMASSSEAKASGLKGIWHRKMTL